MSDEKITMHRKDLKIEGNRNLYSYTFTDASGKLLEPEPTLDSVAGEPGGNLNAEGENRKG